MDESVEQMIADIHAYAEAGDHLIERLQLQKRWNLEDIERLRTGVTLMESIETTNSSARSRDLTRILAEFEASRRDLRASVVAAALAEGATVSEVGEIFGISRQLANRFVKESRARTTMAAQAPGQMAAQSDRPAQSQS